jgi:hypothetical protein
VGLAGAPQLVSAAAEHTGLPGSRLAVSRGPSRSLLVVVFALGLLEVAISPASAHIGDGAAGSNLDGRVTAIIPAVPGCRWGICSWVTRSSWSTTTARRLLVPGYPDEPYLRIEPEGVHRNANSPATYLNLNRYATLSLPNDAAAAAEPDWQQLCTEPDYVWHNHRTHRMSPSQLPPAVAADPARTHTVSRWRIPLEHRGPSSRSP